MDQMLLMGWRYPPCLIQLPNVLCVAATDQQVGVRFATLTLKARAQAPCLFAALTRGS